MRTTCCCLYLGEGEVVYFQQTFTKSHKIAFITALNFFNVTSMSGHFLIHVENCYLVYNALRSVVMKRDLAIVTSFCSFFQLNSVAIAIPDEAMPHKMVIWHLHGLFGSEKENWRTRMSSECK